MKNRLAALLFVALLLTMLPRGLAEEPETNPVCIAYFYNPDCSPCKEIAPLVDSLEETYPFLHIERYNVDENYSAYEDIWQAYKAHLDISYGVPAIYAGNRWYDLNSDHTSFNQTVTSLKEDIVTFEQMGGLSCPITDAGQLRFPRPVCIRAFYDQSGVEIDRVEQALRDNISYVQVTRINGTEFSDEFQQACNQLGRNISLPALFVGDYGFSLSNTSLDTVVAAAKCYELTGIACPSGDDNTICLVFFYSPGCPHCVDAREQLHDWKASTYPMLEIREYKYTGDNTQLLFRYYDALNVSAQQRGTFDIFVGDRYYGEVSQLPDLEDYIAQHADTGLECPQPSANDTVKKEFEALTTVAVIAAGLIDGVNPCAFATLVFFIAYLERVKQGKTAMLSIGVNFSLAVFIGYFLIGLGLLEFYYQIENIGVLSTSIYLFAGGFALLLGALNVVDYFRVGKGDKTVLQLPFFLKKRRGRLIRVLTGRQGVAMLSVMAFLAGLGISLLELACTGQVYLVITAAIHSTQVGTMEAIPLLIVYNVMFILPLLIILAFFYAGYTSEKLGEWQRRHQGAVKLLTAAVLGVIGASMLWVTLG